MNLLQRATKRLVWEPYHFVRYAFPNVMRPEVPLSIEGASWLKAFKENGIVRIVQKEFVELAEYLNKNYIVPFESSTPPTDLANLMGPGLFAKKNNTEKYEKWGVDIKMGISFKDPQVSKLVLNSDFCGVLYNYLRRQPYYRNPVTLQKVSYRAGMDAQGDDSFHVDNLHQISVMLLLSEQTENDTHMQYAIGANHRPILKQGIYLPHCKSRVMAEKYPLFKCTGKVGTLFIFDTSGFHRRYLLPGNPRKMMHLNITTGHHMTPALETFTDWPTLQSKPFFVRHMFDKQICF